MRSWVIGLVPATFIGVALLGMVGNAHPAVAQQSERVAVVSRLGDDQGGGESPAGRQSERVAVVNRFLDAWSRADVDEALSAFADPAVFIAARPTGPCSAATPCTDLAGIRAQIEFGVGLHICQTLRDVQVSGAVVTGKFETRTDVDRAKGVERLERAFMAQIPNDKIAYFAVVNDVSDPQTAGTAPPRAPLPNPETPCAGVV